MLHAPCNSTLPVRTCPCSLIPFLEVGATSTQGQASLVSTQVGIAKIVRHAPVRRDSCKLLLRETGFSYALVRNFFFCACLTFFATPAISKDKDQIEISYMMLMGAITVCSCTAAPS